MEGLGIEKSKGKDSKIYLVSVIIMKFMKEEMEKKIEKDLKINEGKMVKVIGLKERFVGNKEVYNRIKKGLKKKNRRNKRLNIRIVK